jgi:parallel beta-helix repeat protein
LITQLSCLANWLSPDAGLAASRVVSGAKCDGVTDDADAIQRAINAGSVDLPDGATCVVSKAIAIPSNRAIVGRAATLKLKSGASDHVLRNADLTGGNTNIRVQGLIIDHNSAATGGNTIAILLNRVTHSVVSDNTILNARVHAVELANGSTDNKVSNNLIDTFGSSSIGTGITAFRGSDRNRIVGNTIRNGAGGTYGILIDDASDGDADSRPSNWNTVSGNRISRTPYGIGVEGSSFNTIEGNTVEEITRVGLDISSGLNNAPATDNRATQNSFTAVNGGDAAIRVVGRNLLVADNVIDGVRGMARSFVLNTDHGAATPQVNIVVRGNTFRHHTATQPVMRIAPTAVSGLAIEGNVIEPADESGVDATGGGASWRIIDNVICGTRRYGVRIGASATRLTDVVVSGNFIRSLDAPIEIVRDLISISGSSIDGVVVFRNVIVQTHTAVDRGVSISNATHAEASGNVAFDSMAAWASDSGGATAAINPSARRRCLGTR